MAELALVSGALLGIAGVTWGSSAYSRKYNDEADYSVRSNVKVNPLSTPVALSDLPAEQESTSGVGDHHFMSVRGGSKSF